MLADEFYKDMIIGISALGFWLVLIIVSFIIDRIQDMKYSVKYEIRISGQEIRRINKRELKQLLGKENCEKYKYYLKCYKDYFVYGCSEQAWLKESAKIEDHSILIAKPLNVKKDKIVNTDSRIVIFENGRIGKNIKYAIRHVWAIGSADYREALLRSIFEQERFKQILEEYEPKKKILSPYYLQALYDASSSYQDYIGKKYMMVTTEKRTQEIDKDSPEEIVALDTYSAVDKECYQVCLAIKMN